MKEGWYLMSVGDLEIELARARGENRSPSNALAIDTDAALAFRNRGNVPDELGRSLRLVLQVDPTGETSLEDRRLIYEPDFLEAPRWRREGSRPVNVVPLQPSGDAQRGSPRPWWDDPDMAALDAEWRDTGAVGGIRIPAEFRGFVYKTVILLRRAGVQPSVETISDSIARWLAPDQVAEIRAALDAANHPEGG